MRKLLSCLSFSRQLFIDNGIADPSHLCEWTLRISVQGCAQLIECHCQQTLVYEF